MKIAQIIPCTEAEGPGKRFAIWFQGCHLRCPGCCNPEMLQFKGGTKYTLEAMLYKIAFAKKYKGVEGITMMGGEPTAHAPDAADLAMEAHFMGLSVMVFSGYTLQELRDKHDPQTDVLLHFTDILVDGPYKRELPDNKRRWVGSTNQQIHFLSDRYKADDPCWQKSNTLELRLKDNEVFVNGFPSLTAVGLWSRILSPREGST